MSKPNKGRPPRSDSSPTPADPVSRTTLLLFAPSILLGALLLFAVQPLIARYLLPWFGGGPGVWTTCMLFFQALLLGGYLYAHLLVKFLPTRAQLVVHVALLAASLATIPIIPAARWKPVDANDPVGRILLLLAVTIGLPYFVLSATSPLLQSWFVKVRPGISPYRLFALSNLGSFLALLAYPLVLEPLFTRQRQAWIWSGALVAFACVCAACAFHVWNNASAAQGPVTAPSGDGRERQIAGNALLWLTLPLVASILLLAVTNTLTEDVAVTPLLWVIPLALYLLTFVIAFDSPRWYSRRAIFILLPVCTLWVLRLQWLKTETTLLEQFAGYLVALFVLCLFCHGELARLKPDPRDLTAYYLLISVGGALGGVFVAVLAPLLFKQLIELPLGVFAASLLAFMCLRRSPIPQGDRWVVGFVAASVFLLIGVPILRPLLDVGEVRVVERARNFYGTLVVDEGDAGGQGNPADVVRELRHGTTSHGAQFIDPSRRNETTLYYRRGSGGNLAIEFFPRAQNRKIGLVGLGVGTLAAYGKPGDEFRFYEINPDVERLARKYFNFLSDSPATSTVVLGDARLTLDEHEAPQNFDVLVLDAFSGDAIPTHLLTAEAFDVYRRHLKDDAVIAVHISNRSADLIQVVLRHAERMNMSYAIINDTEPTGRLISRWMLITNNQQFLTTPAVRRATLLVRPNPDVTLWTDDHINLLQIVRWMPNGPAAR
jgi:hypothetical protein